MGPQDVSLIDPQPQARKETGHHALMLPFSSRCIVAGDLRGLFEARNNTSRQTPYFRRFPTFHTLKTPSFPAPGARDTGVLPPLDKRPFHSSTAPPPESPIGYPWPAGGNGEG